MSDELLELGVGARGVFDVRVVTDKLLTTRQVADYLGFSPETVLRRYRAGELPGIRLGSNVLRFRESAIETWLAGRERSQAPAASNRPEVVA